MTEDSKPKASNKNISQHTPTSFASIIAEISGDEPNLKVKLTEVKFRTEKARVSLDGEIDYYPVRKQQEEKSQVGDSKVSNDDEKSPFFETGRVILTTGDSEALEVNLKGKLVAVEIKDKDFVKRAIRLRDEIGKLIPKPQANQSEPNQDKSGGALATLRTVAEALSNSGITVTISIEGDIILTLGANANPRLLQLITGTKGVAINQFFKLIELLI